MVNLAALRNGRTLTPLTKNRTAASFDVPRAFCNVAAPISPRPFPISISTTPQLSSLPCIRSRPGARSSSLPLVMARATSGAGTGTGAGARTPTALRAAGEDGAAAAGVPEPPVEPVPEKSNLPFYLDPSTRYGRQEREALVIFCCISLPTRVRCERVRFLLPPDPATNLAIAVASQVGGGWQALAVTDNRCGEGEADKFYLVILPWPVDPPVLDTIPCQ